MVQGATNTADAQEQSDRIEAFSRCRSDSLRLCSNLSAEDHMVQGAPFASPPKWHLAHTTWFFSTFLLKPLGLEPSIPNSWNTLFNSYYNGIGLPHARAHRGILSRPALSNICTWREQVDHEILQGLNANHFNSSQLQLLDLGIQHEMQHQELLLTDLLYSFSLNPSHPAYSATPVTASPDVNPVVWLTFDGGLVDVGAGAEGFSFDNEQPRHRHFLEPFAIADRLVTNGEYQQFMAADGYSDPQWWLSEGWDTVNR